MGHDRKPCGAADVYADDVAVPENGGFAWYAMDNHVVYGNARTRGKAAVTEKRGGSPLFLLL